MTNASPKKLVFLTGTRADFGKLLSLLQALDKDPRFDLYVYVTGMHLSKEHGSTYLAVERYGFKHTFVDYSSYAPRASMSVKLGTIVTSFSRYVEHVEPDMIVVHGDRLEAMAGALVASLNHIRLAHIEGGEITGTIDESLRHSITKLANEHFVANEEARETLLKLGEPSNRIFVIGSPDMDAMAVARQGDLAEVKAHYAIPFDHYGIALFHPTTTEYKEVGHQAQSFVGALKKSGLNWVVIYPNNDLGYEEILYAYKALEGDSRFRVIPSLRFMSFLTLLANADVMVGNSSAGIRETCVYGIPTVDIGTRQNGRYNLTDVKNIAHSSYEECDILEAINSRNERRLESSNWGDGHSDEKFMSIVETEAFWQTPLQKRLKFGD